MKRVLILGTLGVVLNGCALFSKLPGPVNNVANAAGGAVGKLPAALEEGGRRAKVKCDPIKNNEVAFPEERAMGGAVQVKRVKENNGLLLDGMTATDPEAMMKDVDAKKKIELPASAKNDLTTYVAIVGHNLARYSERPTIPWTFAVIENETPNAFSSPGGYVVVTTGLMKKMTNEAQLAGVLGHEIAHVVHRHAIKRYRTAKHVQCTAATAGGYVVAELGESIIASLPGDMREAQKYVRDFENFDLDKAGGPFIKWFINGISELVSGANDKEDEFQADATALSLVAFAGYDPTEYEKFLTSLGEQGGFLSSHPATTDRVAKLKAAREGDLAPFAVGTAKPDFSKVLNAAIKK